MSFYSKLKHRNVFRSVLAYTVAAWLLIEVMELITETFGAPPWVLKVFVSVMVVGLLPVMIFSWLYEITPEGIKREGGDGLNHSSATTRKLNIAIVVMLAVVIGLYATQQFRGQPGAVQAPSQATTPLVATEQGAANATDKAQEEGPPMVAVLPFSSVSLDGASDFFATGVHDDLLTQLAKMESMRVISRTSVLEYKDTIKNIREIGQELLADIILEGGVQAAGERIRINAQLIDAETDEHLWAETYDRELTTANIFDVQREISVAIAKAMNATLTTQDNQQLRVIPTENMAAYRAYHRALDIRNAPSGRGIAEPEYIVALEEAIALDPDFVRPRAELVGIISLSNSSLVETDPEIARQAEQHLELIRNIAPDSAEYLIAETYYIYYILRDFDHAYEVVSRALARNPSDIYVLELKSWIERRQQKIEPRMETLRELLRLDPRNPVRISSVISHQIITHQYDGAAADLAESSVESNDLSYFRAMFTLRENGDFEQYSDAMQKLYEEDPVTFLSDRLIAYWLERDFDSAQQLQAQLDAATIHDSEGIDVDVLVTYWLVDDPEQLDDYIEESTALLDAHMDSNGNPRGIDDYIYRALVFAAQGDREATLRNINQWERLTVDDPTLILFLAPVACASMGMVEAETEAVNCLRKYLVESSYVMPFIDPYLPMYDAIRDGPAFTGLMSDIEAGMYD